MPLALPQDGEVKKKLRRGRFLRVALSVAFIAGLAWALHELDLTSLSETFRHAAWPLVALAGLLQLAALTPARVLRWRVLLPQHPATRAGLLAMVVFASQAMSNVLPLRAGEAYRTVVLSRRGLPVDRVLASQVAEKLAEGASLVTFAVPVLVAPALFRGATRAYVVAGVAVMALVVAVLFVQRIRSSGGALARRIAGAFETLRTPGVWIKAYAFALMADAVDVAMIVLCARAVGQPLSLLGCATVLVGVNIAIAIPAAPGQIGTLDAGAVAALVALGAPDDRALAFALLYHAAHLVPGTLAGTAVLATERVRLRVRARTETTS